MNASLAIFQDISSLIISTSSYNKSIEADDSVVAIDQSTFAQLEEQVSKLTIKDDELFTSEHDYLSPLLLFLLEQQPLEIDLNLLTSTETSYQQAMPSARKLYRPNLTSVKHPNRLDYCAESQRILQSLVQYLQISNLKDFLLLQQNAQPIYLRCFQLLSSLLSKTTYHQYPTAIVLFVHIVKSLPSSALAETFDLIFPICLMTLDDPSTDMKLISLCLLNHLQKHCTTTELLLFNRANVIMYGLEQNLHRRGDPSPFFECLLATTYRWMIILENEDYSGKHLFNYTSQLIERLIRDALLETNIEYRRCLLRSLRCYLHRLELFAIRHLNHFLELIDDSSENRLLRDDSLQLLLSIIQLLKPRINAHRLDVMKILVRCLFKIFQEDKDNPSVKNLLRKCAHDLQACTMEHYVRDAFRSLIETTELDSSYREFLRKFVDTVEGN